jgi:hypothetical protein
MLLAVARAESWRAQQQARWFSLWLKEWSRADKAESALRAIHEKHVAAGKAGRRKQISESRAKILAKAAELRAGLQNTTVVQFKDAA